MAGLVFIFGRRIGFLYAKPLKNLSSVILHWILAIAFVTSFVNAAFAGGGPRNVLLVINRASESSRAIGNYYKNARNIPQSNICFITCTTEEVVSREDFETSIREPIRHFIVNNNLESRIDYIVVTKGIPLIVRCDCTCSVYNSSHVQYLSLSNILTCVTEPYYQFYDPADPRNTAATLINPYGPGSVTSMWADPAPECAWSHQLAFRELNSNPPRYRRFFAVNRLDGYSVEIVKAMIDRGLQPSLDGNFAFDGK